MNSRCSIQWKDNTKAHFFTHDISGCVCQVGESCVKARVSVDKERYDWGKTWSLNDDIIIIINIMTDATMEAKRLLRLLNISKNWN